MKKFWNFLNSEENSRELVINGVIAEDSWFDDEVTPKLFEEDLNAGSGDITLWINSPGGDCFAAATIYNMLMKYPGKITVKIDALAASAASVIAMAGDQLMMTPVSMLMIHNPTTVTCGESEDFEKVKNMLDSVKESIINAYMTKSKKLTHDEISNLMDGETYIDAKKAIELGFCDEIVERADYGPLNVKNLTGTQFNVKKYQQAIVNKLTPVKNTHSKLDAYKRLLNCAEKF